MNNDRKYKLQSAAYHEAGHAVYAILHPEMFRIKFIRIFPNGGGMVNMDYTSINKTGRDNARIYCMMKLAGQEAEQEFLEFSHDVDCEEDRQFVLNMMAHSFVPGSRKTDDLGFINYFEQLEYDTAEWVAQHKESIAALANMILRDRFIIGRHASRLVHHIDG